MSPVCQAVTLIKRLKGVSDFPREDLNPHKQIQRGKKTLLASILLYAIIIRICQ